MGDEHADRGAARDPAPPLSAPVRIGELSRRVGVRPETLRAWERRYGLFEPGRTPGNYRLYSAADEARVRAMTGLIAQGVSASEAAKLARAAPGIVPGPGIGVTEAGSAARGPVLSASAAELLTALAAYDEDEASDILDAAFARFSLDQVLVHVVLPMLAEIGERWARAEVTVAQEHFCTEFVRGRLLAIGRGWGGGDGPLALLACPPGEHHDLGLIVFGIAIRERGWRVALFGADTPVETLADAAEKLRPSAIVIATVEAGRLEAARGPLRRLAEHHPLLVGGRGAGPAVAGGLGAAHLGGDPAAAADLLALATAAE